MKDRKNNDGESLNIIALYQRAVKENIVLTPASLYGNHGHVSIEIFRTKVSFFVEPKKEAIVNLLKFVEEETGNKLDVLHLYTHPISIFSDKNISFVYKKENRIDLLNLDEFISFLDMLKERFSKSN